MRAAIGVVVGIVLSGPASVWLVESTHPQPAWQGAKLFVLHRHPIQLVPYLGGLVLVVALLALIASLHALGDESRRVRSNCALMSGAAFAARSFVAAEWSDSPGFRLPPMAP